MGLSVQVAFSRIGPSVELGFRLGSLLLQGQLRYITYKTGEQIEPTGCLFLEVIRMGDTAGLLLVRLQHWVVGVKMS